MTGYNPWIDAAIMAAIWLPIVGALIVHEYRKSKKPLRGASRVSN